MTADVELLPLPYPNGSYINPYDGVDLKAYARANVAHATAAKDAQIEALRAEVEMLRDAFSDEDMTAGAHWFGRYVEQKRRAERLAEALRLALNSHGKTLLTDPPQDAWKVSRVEEIGRALLREQEEGNGQ